MTHPGHGELSKSNGAQVAIVTGAGSRGDGIGNGRASAIALASAGSSVALIDYNVEWAHDTKRMLPEGTKSLVIKADVTNPEECRNAVDATVEEFGKVSSLVNNVGVAGARGDALAVDPDEWDYTMKANVKSMMLMSKFAIPELIRSNGGAIVNVSSASGLRGGHPNLAYPTSKAAVIGLTRAMAAHHGANRIRVNCVAPGMVYTPMVISRGMSEELREARRAQALLPDEGTGWDVGKAVAWLASDDARWITGVVLEVDGGSTAATRGKPSPG